MREKEVREMRDEGLNSGTGQNSCEKGLKRSNKKFYTTYILNHNFTACPGLS